MLQASGKTELELGKVKITAENLTNNTTFHRFLCEIHDDHCDFMETLEEVYRKLDEQGKEDESDQVYDELLDMHRFGPSVSVSKILALTRPYRNGAVQALK